MCLSHDSYLSHLSRCPSSVCIKDQYTGPSYLEGPVLITRSPAIHPGDVQLVTAVGRPPPGSPFEYEELPNCVVFSCKGNHTFSLPSLRSRGLILTRIGRRSLPQSLGGGDLDGDLYNVIELYKAPQFTPDEIDTPGSYPPTVLKLLPEGQTCTISDVAVSDLRMHFLGITHILKIGLCC